MIINHHFAGVYYLFIIIVKMKGKEASRQTLLQGLHHLYNNSNFDESIIFSVDIISLITYSSQQLEKFRKNPSEYLKEIHQYFKVSLKKYLQEEQFEDMLKYHKTSILLNNIPFSKNLYPKLNSFSSNDIGKWIVVTGTVVQALQAKALQKSKVFTCNECGAEYRKDNSYQNYYRFDLPQGCTNMVQKEKSNNLFTTFYKNMNKRKGQNTDQAQKTDKRIAKCGSYKFTPIDDKKICLDYQEIRIQEQFKHISAGKLPQTVIVIIQSGEGSNWRPGDDVVVSGILDYRFKKPSNEQKLQLQMVIIANSITLQRSSSSKDSNDRESLPDETQSDFFGSYNEGNPNAIPSISREIELRNTIVKKFCPNIFGRQNVKLGLLLGLLGGVSIHNENTRIRGQSHILLIGQPGTGKSVLIKEAANLAQRSFFTNGIGTSSAGLSVSYYKQGSDWTIEPGALVLADNGVCCIDELTLLPKKDENSLLQAMQQQTVCSAKASVVGKLNARTTVIGACNPITPNQRYEPSLDLEVNTGLSIPLLTRFDLILILKDENTRVEDSMKCDHILQKFAGVEVYCSEPKQQFSLRAFLKKCKRYEPQLRGGQLLSKYYIQQRQNMEKVTTARAFQSLCRLSEAHAKLMMRDFTTDFDCITAIMLTQGMYVSTMEDYFAYVSQFNQKYHTDIELEY